MSDVSVRILGPLEVSVDGRRVELGGARQRTLFAILAVRANEVISSDRLVEELWRERPPSTAHKALQNAVSELRAALGAAGTDLILTQSPGYALRLDDDTVDARRFERLAAEARLELEESPHQAAKLLREALGLWRGEPLADFAYDGFAQAEILRLEELRLSALEDRIHADLALGRHTELVAELEPLVAAHPLRERLRGQLMVALYRSGRQADALKVYRQGRAILHEELGLEPGVALRELEQAVLTQDESLGPHPKLPSPRLRVRPRRIALAAAVGLLGIVAAVLVVALLPRDRAKPVVVPDSIVKIDPATNEIVADIPVGKNPGPLAIVGRYLFVASEDEGALYRIDMDSGEVTASGRYDATAGIAGEGDSRLWVVSAGQSSTAERPAVARVDAASLDSFDRVALPIYSAPIAIAVGGGSLWVSEAAPPAVSRWSLQTLRLERRYRLRPISLPLAIGFGAGAAWVADAGGDQLLRIDARSGRITPISVGHTPVSPVVAFGSVWVQMLLDATVWRIDPATRRPQAIIRVPEAPQGLAAGAGALWVGGGVDGVLSRIDPATNSVVATIETGYYPRVPAVGGGFLWVGVSGKP